MESLASFGAEAAYASKMKREAPKEPVERAEYTFDWTGGATTGAK